MTEAWSPATCSLSPLTEPASKGGCRWDGVALPGRRRVWCSDACLTVYLENHFWTEARSVAIRRASITDERGRPLLTFCDQCRKRCGRLSTLLGATGHRYGGQSEAEVNHVEPRLGQGYDDGCWNHQTNLQVLCHGCHVMETQRQKRERIAVGTPGLEPHDAWRRQGWTWVATQAWIDGGAHPGSREALAAQMAPLWDLA